MLSNLRVRRRPGTYAYVQLPEQPAPLPVVAALVAEDEGATIVVELEVARAEGWPVEFEAAWLTLEVHSALDSVGLTAAVATALAAEGIPCNVLAGARHDHLLVPVAEADGAIAALTALRRQR